MKDWHKRQYDVPAPQVVKQEVLRRHGVVGAQWVETGTFRGKTTKFLLSLAPKVFTIEPEPSLFRDAKKLFRDTGAEVLNGVSEEIFPQLLPTLSGDVNFWLDGHYSAGVTFQGDKDCPVEEELNAIGAHLSQFSRISILIDDVRCFLPQNGETGDYPSIDHLVDWARQHGFDWQIEHDIFIIRNWR